jgi:hypothetical protein
MVFRQLFDQQSSTYTYLLADAQSRDALLIDPVFGALRAGYRDPRPRQLRQSREPRRRHAALARAALSCRRRD